MAEDYLRRFVKLSIYDCVALAIAKCRGIVLMTGDGLLRKVAQEEGVVVLGTIGVLDRLFNGKYIDRDEYLYCLNELSKHNGGKVRLPETELNKRIEQVGF